MNRYYFSSVIIPVIPAPFILPVSGPAEDFSISSPDKKISLNVSFNGEKTCFVLTYEKEPVLLNSPLHFQLDGNDIVPQATPVIMDEIGLIPRGLAPRIIHSKDFFYSKSFMII